MVSIEDMDEEFTVTAAMLVRLCDVVLQGELEPDALHGIGFALAASIRFAGTLMRTMCLRMSSLIGRVPK